MRLIVCILLVCGSVMFSACAKNGAIDISTFEITPTTGVAGTTQVCVMYTDNEKRTECKEAMLTITDGESSKSVKVVQEPPKLEYIPKSLEFSSEGGTKEMYVETNFHGVSFLRLLSQIYLFMNGCI